MYELRVYFHPILDETNHPRERNLTIDNGLPEADDHFQRVTLCVKLLPHGHLDVAPLEITEGVTFRLLPQYLAPEALRAHWVNAVEGSWLNVNGYDVGPIISTWSKPELEDLVFDLARVFERTVIWEDEVDEQGDLA